MRTAIVIGAGTIGRDFVREFRKVKITGIKLIGYLDDDVEKACHFYENLPILGNIDELSEIINTYHVQEVIVALPIHYYGRLIEVCEQLKTLSVNVHVLPDMFTFSITDIKNKNRIPEIEIEKTRMRNISLIIKRVFDFFFSSLAIMLLAPFMGLLIILIRAESPGPAIFKQIRVGKGGRLFTMYKFRTMRAGVDQTVHKEYVSKLITENVKLEDLTTNSMKMDKDNRITKLGYFLRKTSFDELPQLFNALHGDMSVVGPRPPIPYEVALYKEWHKQRLEVLPGLTGLWQVKGRNQVSFDDMVRMDIEYIQNRSLWMDVAIILQTFLVPVTGKGAG